MRKKAGACQRMSSRAALTWCVIANTETLALAQFSDRLSTKCGDVYTKPPFARVYRLTILSSAVQACSHSELSCVWGTGELSNLRA